MILSYRPMTEADLPSVMDIENSAGPHPWRSNHFLDSLKSNHNCTVALQENIIVGHGIVMLIADEAHLLILSIGQQHQGKGFGKALLQHLISEAINLQAKTLFLEVRESNTTAYNLYMEAGFNEVGRRNDYYPVTGQLREDAIVMAMELSQ